MHFSTHRNKQICEKVYYPNIIKLYLRRNNLPTGRQVEKANISYLEIKSCFWIECLRRIFMCYVNLNSFIFL